MTLLNNAFFNNQFFIVPLLLLATSACQASYLEGRSQPFYMPRKEQKPQTKQQKLPVLEGLRSAVYHIEIQEEEDKQDAYNAVCSLLFMESDEELLPAHEGYFTKDEKNVAYFLCKAATGQLPDKEEESNHAAKTPKRKKRTRKNTRRTKQQSQKKQKSEVAAIPEIVAPNPHVDEDEVVIIPTPKKSLKDEHVCTWCGIIQANYLAFCDHVLSNPDTHPLPQRDVNLADYYNAGQNRVICAHCSATVLKKTFKAHLAHHKIASDLCRRNS